MMSGPRGEGHTSLDILGHNDDMLHRLQRSPRTFPRLPDHSTNSACRRGTNATRCPRTPVALSSVAPCASSGSMIAPSAAHLTSHNIDNCALQRSYQCAKLGACRCVRPLTKFVSVYPARGAMSVLRDSRAFVSASNRSAVASASNTVGIIPHSPQSSTAGRTRNPAAALSRRVSSGGQRTSVVMAHMASGGHL